MTSFDPSIKSTGRTGWDVIVSSKLFILIFLIGIIAVVLLLIYKDSFTGFGTQIDILIETYQYFLIPPIAGIMLGRYIYRRYLLIGVILLVVSLDKPTRCIRMSRHTFATYTKTNGLCNPESTHYGESLYYIKSIDFEKKIIDSGWIHDKKVSIPYILGIKANYTKLLENSKDVNTKLVELMDFPFISGTQHGMNVVNKHTEILEKVLFGKSTDDVKISDFIDVKEESTKEEGSQ